MTSRLSYLRYGSKLIAPTLFCLATSITLNDKCVEVVSVNGPSMAPTLSPTYHETGQRDYLLLSKWNPTRDLKRGDVVSFYAPHKPDTLGIKRVVGIEGDLIELDVRRKPDSGGIGGGVGNGESWEVMGATHDHVGKRMVRVPPGHVWVEGDNWRRSRDSNWYGPISKSLINGKAVCIVLPWKRFGEKPWEKFKAKTKVTQGQQVWRLGWEDL